MEISHPVTRKFCHESIITECPNDIRISMKIVVLGSSGSGSMIQDRLKHDPAKELINYFQSGFIASFESQ